MLLAILRHRNKIVELFHKGGIELEGLINPTIAEIKGDKSDKTSVNNSAPIFIESAKLYIRRLGYWA